MSRCYRKRYKCRHGNGFWDLLLHRLGKSGKPDEYPDGMPWLQRLPFGQVYILNSKTNGYHDLEIFTDETHFFLKYQNGAYQYISID